MGIFMLSKMMAAAAMVRAQMEIDIELGEFKLSAEFEGFDGATFTTYEETDEPCCNTCDLEGMEKYYSIDHIFHQCGECCMDPKDFWLYKVFEPGLTKDDDNVNPCSSRNYTEYRKTETHGAGPISMTLDMYGKVKTEEEEDM